MTKLLALASLLTILSGCHASQVVDTHKMPVDPQAKLRQEISGLTQHSRCEQAQQCRVAGDVVKPCGGFRSFFAYSSVGVDERLLQAKLDTYYALQKDQNARRGLISDCSFVSPPEAICVNAQCVLPKQP